MWDQAVVTNAGKALLQQWAGGGTLTIDGAKAGAGAVSQLNLINQTAVTQEKQTLSIISAKQVEGGTQFHVQITAPDAGYTAKQIGIYGHLDSGDSTLIALYQDESGITVPSKTEMPDFVYAFYATIQGSNTGTLSVTLDTSALVTQATLNAAVAKAGDMKKSVYDADNDGVVDNAKKLDGKMAAQFAAASHSHAISAITGLQTALDNKASVSTYSASLLSTGWTGDAAPYAQEVTVTGITAADTPLVDIVQTGTEATDEPMREAWGVVTRIVTGAGKITAYASEKPTVNIPIQLKVVKNNG